MCNEHIRRKTSISEPNGPWSMKSEIDESARSQEVMLDKNDTCEGISVEYCFLDAIPSLFQKVERDESKRINKEKESESAKERHDKSSYSLELKLDSLLRCYYSCVANIDSFVLGVENKEELKQGVLENKGKSLEKEPLNLQEETTMSFSLNPSPLYYEYSFKELKLLLESHSFNLLNDDLVIESMIASVLYSCASMWSKGEFLEKAVFEEVYRKFCDLENFVNTFPCLKYEVVKSLKHEEYSSLPLEFFWKMCFSCPCLWRRVCPNFKSKSLTSRI
ncbi:hypothetical protein M9H77_02231 [Catharanthus roseus]|uniref:Uncharacterized protein n=1 Tax=Catharanthus roseus TaxID=4058 RepID=A0ACC0C7T1_CATRO|nr:hypothetical protein M9H77_02231 [Catharanthus roseus]